MNLNNGIFNEIEPEPEPMPEPEPEQANNNLLCLTENSEMNIIYSSGNKYVLNGETEYSQDRKYGLHNGNGTRTSKITHIPITHPLDY